MGLKKRNIWTVGLFLIFTACKSASTDVEYPLFQLLNISTNNIQLSADNIIEGIPLDGSFRLVFSTPIDTSSAKTGITLLHGDKELPLSYNFKSEYTSLTVKSDNNLENNVVYTLRISNDLRSVDQVKFIEKSYSFRTEIGEIKIVSALINNIPLSISDITREVNFDEVQIELIFDNVIDLTTFRSHFRLQPSVGLEFSQSDDSLVIYINNTNTLDYYKSYSILISSQLENPRNFIFAGYNSSFQTGLNPKDKFPRISDDELLTKIQEQTFKYFWDFAHPVSGLARERNSSGELVTIGGSGFGLMALLVGIERNFISVDDGIKRIGKILDFLSTKADRFHGVWPHWLNGSTGKTIPFSSQDNGADLVETAFLAQGLITVREYVKEYISEEHEYVSKIDTLITDIEWNWFTRGNQNVLYWHWSPDYEWGMNMKISGYNEALIVYILAASSKNYGISSNVYHAGWARSGDIRNGRKFYGLQLPLGYDYGGPLFFSHYSFLGLNPTNLSDRYADYWTQNRNHSLINRQYVIENPKQYIGYSKNSWGLTASDTPNGYLAHEPTRDVGTITPSAAISSIPYTPNESLEAIRHFYYKLGDKLWGEYGFYDAFNPTEDWWANTYLAIDQGPIIIMIENYRSGLLWDLFMHAEEIQAALNFLEFSLNN